MRRSIGPEPPTRKATMPAAPKRSAKRSSSSGVADAKSVRNAGGGHSKIGPPLLVRRWPERLRANTPAIILAGALAIQMLAFSTTEGRVKSATAEAEVLGGRHRGGLPKALDGSPEGARPM